MLLIDLYMMVGGVRPSRLDLERFVLSIVGIVIILSRVVLGFPRSGWSVTLQRESTSLYNITPMENSEKMDGVEDEKTSLKAFEAWMDEAGVDRRGSTRLRRFVGRGIGLEACRELERDSTVRAYITSLTPLCIIITPLCLVKHMSSLHGLSRVS